MIFSGLFGFPFQRKNTETRRNILVQLSFWFSLSNGKEEDEPRKIPLVVNVPGPLSMVRAFCGIVDTSTAINFLGLHIARRGAWGTSPKYGLVYLFFLFFFFLYCCLGCLFCVCVCCSVILLLLCFPLFFVRGPRRM